MPGPLKPLIAIPTTAGTGSETTGVSLFDLSKMHAKTGIASRRLKPTIGLLDPENTRTMPAQVAAATGLDVLSHAVESYTALPYSDRPLDAVVASPSERVCTRVSISENSLVVSELSPRGRTGSNVPCYHPLIRLAHRLEPRRSR